jgi:hypothetical protein
VREFAVPTRLFIPFYEILTLKLRERGFWEEEREKTLAKSWGGFSWGGFLFSARARAHIFLSSFFNFM